MFKVINKDTTSCSSVSIVNFEHVIAGWELIRSNIKAHEIKKTYKKKFELSLFSQEAYLEPCQTSMMELFD